ncbi:MAG TPA: nuclear transport factor 2 family protein [Steroidobacteraceae bacterium]|nr:nuclear transport factor 2 family protein [Steroidobacteraceae bacterium]
MRCIANFMVPVLLGLSVSAAALPAAAAESATSAVAATPADAGLIEFTKAWMDAALGRDTKFIAAHSIAAPKESFLVFGTSGEQGHRYDEFLDHLNGLKPFKWTEIIPEGYVVGDFAWLFGTAQAPMPTGDVAKARWTMVARRVHGEWKAVHFHLSEPVPRKGIKKGS